MTQNPMLKSFDPFITHTFTNGSGLATRPPLPSSYPASLPSSHVRAYRPKSFSLGLYPLSDSSDSSSVTSTDSNSSSQNSTPIHSPKPTRAPSIVSPPPPQIFEKFRKDATTPELVLKKRPVQSKVVSRSK